MRITRLVALAVITATTGLTTGVGAQNLRSAGPPAEFPPSSYAGKQYVDSRGCVYIRAGIDGATTWVPRVTRDRKQVCGYKPSLGGQQVASTAPARPAAKPEVITIEASPTAPRATAPRPVPVPVPRQATAPRQVATAPSPQPQPQLRSAPEAPVRTASAPVSPFFGLVTTRQPSPGPEPTLYINPEERDRSSTSAPEAAPATVSVPRRVTVAAPQAARPSPGPAPTLYENPAPRRASPSAPAPRPATPAVQAGGCPNASAFSQQYINKTGVRCGPQSEPPVTIRPMQSGSAAPVLAPQRPVVMGSVASPVSPETRILARHIYEERQSTVVGMVPEGYRRVWEDGRLNPRRAERTPKPAVARRPSVPEGYRLAWDDDRLNRHRGGTATGEMQSAQIWTDTVPRKLVPVETDRPVIRLPSDNVSAAPRPPGFTPFRLSTRSAAEAPAASASQTGTARNTRR